MTQALTLILMRHAKSNWDSPEQSDHDRPLNARGIWSAKALGDWMRRENLVPDQVLCSSAQRTRDTLAGLNLNDANVQYLDALYHAGPDRMAGVLAKATGRVILMIGHNPGIAEFAGMLVKETPEHMRFWDYPTGSTLVVEFAEDSWTKAATGRGKCTHFVTPPDLPDA